MGSHLLLVFMNTLPIGHTLVRTKPQTAPAEALVGCEEVQLHSWYTLHSFLSLNTYTPGLLALYGHRESTLPVVCGDVELGFWTGENVTTRSSSLLDSEEERPRRGSASATVVDKSITEAPISVRTNTSLILFKQFYLIVFFS